MRLRAKVVMSDYPVTLEIVSTVADIGKAIDTGFSVFPVINRSGQIVGMIASNFLIVLIE